MAQAHRSTMIPSPDQSSTHSYQRQFFPKVNHCCGCVTELKTATAIIAVLGVVTSPVVSWAFIRHSYVIRVSCFVSTSSERADVVDIHLKNVLSFGFGAHAGLGPSCLAGLGRLADRGKRAEGRGAKNITHILRQLGKKNITRRSHDGDDVKSDEHDEFLNSGFLRTVRWIGWFLLFADIIFIVLSLHLLYSIFNPPAKYAARRFIISCTVSISLSFIHGMMYVGMCVVVGASFPIFEFTFCTIDVIAWAYFLIVVNSYRRHLNYDE